MSTWTTKEIARAKVLYVGERLTVKCIAEILTRHSEKAIAKMFAFNGIRKHPRGKASRNSGESSDTGRLRRCHQYFMERERKFAGYRL